MPTCGDLDAIAIVDLGGNRPTATAHGGAIDRNGAPRHVAAVAATKGSAGYFMADRAGAEVAGLLTLPGLDNNG